MWTILWLRVLCLCVLGVIVDFVDELSSVSVDWAWGEVDVD